MTVAKLEDRTLTRLGEISGAPVYYDSQEVLFALNEAQRFFCFLTLCLEGTAEFPLLAATSFYHMLDTFGDWLAPLRVRVRGAGGKKLRTSTLSDFRALDPSWAAAAGAPERYAHLGFDFLAIYKRPAAGGTSLDVTYARTPAPMFFVSDTPEIPAEYHESLIGFGIPRLRAKEGGSEFLKTMPEFDRFLNAAQKLGGYVAARNRELGYDRMPFEIDRIDRSQLAKVAMKG